MSNTNGHHWIRNEKRVRIYARDGWRCQWCRRSASDGAKLTLDHFLARDAGGKNDAGNLLTACFGCNSERRNLPAIAYAFDKALDLLGGPPALLDRILDALERPLPVFVP